MISHLKNDMFVPVPTPNTLGAFICDNVPAHQYRGAVGNILYSGTELPSIVTVCGEKLDAVWAGVDWANARWEIVVRVHFGLNCIMITDKSVITNSSHTYPMSGCGLPSAQEELTGLFTRRGI